MWLRDTMLKGAALGAVLMAATPALADGRVYVPWPDMSSFKGEAAETLLYQLVLATVVGSNCQNYMLTDPEWSLLSDASDLLAFGQLGLSVADYDDRFFYPAFNELDTTPACSKVGPKIDLLISQLEALGGSVIPFPDQDAAYLEWSALQDRLNPL